MSSKPNNRIGQSTTAAAAVRTRPTVPSESNTEQADWKPGEVFVAANGLAFRIVDTDAEVEAAGMVLFHPIWTVEPAEESGGRPRRASGLGALRVVVEDSPRTI